MVHREVDNATLTAIEEKIAKEKAKLAKMAASGSALVERQTSASADTGASNAMETASSSADKSSSIEGKKQPEPMETDDAKVVNSASEPVAKQTVPADKTESSISEGARVATTGPTQRQEAQAAGIHFSTPGSNEYLPPHIRAVSLHLAQILKYMKKTPENCVKVKCANIVKCSKYSIAY